MKSRSIANLVTGLIVSCSLLLLTGTAIAERGQRGHRGFNPDKMLEMMSSNLDLTTEQQDQVRTILESHKPQFEQLGERMRSTLTEEQRASLKEMRKNRRANNGGERPSREDRRAKMADLGISQEQMEQLRSIRQQMKSQRELVRNEISAVLTPDQQAKLEEMKSKRRGHRGMRGERGDSQ